MPSPHRRLPDAPDRAAVRPLRRRATLAGAITLAVALGLATTAAADDADPTTPPAAPPAGSTTTTVPAEPTPATTTTTTTTTTTPSTTTTTTVATVPPTAPATSGPPVPAPRHVTVFPEQIGHILATIRYLESRGQYEIPPNKGNASGAYQFIASTWNNYGGYPHAYLAPPAVQDERAAADVVKFLAQWNNDVSMIPVMWYYPRAAREPALMDVVPIPSAGNVLTIREYQQRWLSVFATISGQPLPQQAAAAQDPVVRTGLPPNPARRSDGRPNLAFPVLGPSRLAAPDCEAAAAGDGPFDLADIEAAGLCAAAPPSIVFGVKLQPVLAVADGVVTSVDDEPGSGRPISMTITDVTGRRYEYSGFNDDTPGTKDGAAPAHLRLTALARVGQVVWAGQVIGFMGDSEPLPVGVRADVPTDATVVIDPDATAPHLRLSIVELDGTPVDAFGPVLDAAFATSCRVGIGPWSVPARSGSTRAVVIETTDDDRTIDSEWVITESGQVMASGWAAMVNPSELCEWTPAEAYGPGASGSDDVPGHWWFGLDLPIEVWLGLALAGEGPATPPLFLR